MIGAVSITWALAGYQIDAARKRLLWIGQHRRAKTLLQFFRWFGTERAAALRFICSDMWKPYLQVVGSAGTVLSRTRQAASRLLSHAASTRNADNAKHCRRFIFVASDFQTAIVFGRSTNSLLS